MRYRMLIDSQKCLDCKACIIACQQRNSVPYGYARNWVRQTGDETALSGMHYQPGACMHCENPPCVSSCPTLATYEAENGAIVVDAERCIGCGNCIETCPYEARFKHPVTGAADKCDYCLGSGSNPACVEVCPTGCRIFGDVDDPDSLISKQLSTRKVIHVRPDGYSIKPTLAYLDRTVPVVLPVAPQPNTNSRTLSYLANGLAWAGSGALLALGGVWLRQKLRPSTQEDERLEKENQEESK